MAALTTTIDKRISLGNMRGVVGHWVNSGTGGEVNTGLRQCHALFASPLDSSVVADQFAINETLPCDGSAVTVVTTSNALTWKFFAIGY